MAKQPAGLARYWAGKRRNKSTRRRSGGVSMSKRKGTKFTLPVAAILGFAPLAYWAKTDFKSEGLNGLRKTAETIIPFDISGTHGGGFMAHKLQYGLYPIIGGLFVHKLAGMLGVNRMLSRAGIPFIRL